jgi:monovalent cation:H+ antiporter-2, CPA2 family
MTDPLLHLLGELTLLIGASAALAYVGQRYFRVVPLVGFLLTGVLIGPHALGLVSDMEMVEAAAEIGVILLLFTIGIEFSLERLARIRRLIFGGGTLQLVLTVGVVAIALGAAGVPWRPALYTGCLAALSSTAIALKLLADRGATGAAEGQAALGILLFQDLAVVVLVLLLPALAGAGGGTGDVITALIKAAVILLLVLVLARRVLPAFLERIARACSPDIFLLTIIAVCFGTAWLASAAGIGVSLGAFLAGLIVSESRFSEHALSEILPLRILFSAAFFVSIGMLLDPAFLLAHPALVAGVVLAVLLVKTATTALSLRALGTPAAVAVPAALLLAQIGEFAFVLERRGSALGLFPAGAAELGGQTFIAVTVLLMVATPAFAAAGPRVARMFGHGTTMAAPATPSPEQRTTLAGHVLIAGYGEAARRLAPALERANVDFVIVTLSPDGAREAEAVGRHVIRGDYARRPILELAGIAQARTLVVADDDVRTTERVVAVAKAIAPALAVIARTERLEDAATLTHAGADHVVAAEGAADRELMREVLAAAGADADRIALVTAGLAPDAPEVRLSEAVLASSACDHARETRTVRPITPAGCQECLAEGDRWVHLRLCMACGHVGCCDSSPNRHASAHFEETGHPIVRSWEPGEDWAWCFVDRVRL